MSPGCSRRKRRERHRVGLPAEGSNRTEPPFCFARLRGGELCIRAGAVRRRDQRREGGAMTDRPSDSIFGGVGAILDDLEELYKDVHRHPELSMNEERTAGLAAERLNTAGYEVTTRVGKTGVVGVLSNGDGPTVMLRADMDALPVQEQTGLDYASEIDGVMHACGHDMHVAWLAGAAALLASRRELWQGSLMAVFQPAEETAAGAQAMIDDGLFARFAKPDVILGQHVMPPA